MSSRLHYWLTDQFEIWKIQFPQSRFWKCFGVHIFFYFSSWIFIIKVNKNKCMHSISSSVTDWQESLFNLITEWISVWKKLDVINNFFYILSQKEKWKLICQTWLVIFWREIKRLFSNIALISLFKSTFVSSTTTS